MKRSDFLKKSLLAGVAGAIAPSSLQANSEAKSSTYDILMERIGYNHLPNQEHKTMNTVLHKSETRGHANHGWLDANHSFSFANYHNPERMNFGVLRVLNDDRIAASKGFGTHPHDNMEIITIPLEGDLQHRDNMGNGTVIKHGDVQVMSAGTGITHSEFNANNDRDVKLLQIWLFPKLRNVTPRYDQISINQIAKENELYQILSPNSDDAGVWIHQDAWFHLGKFTKDTKTDYNIKRQGNGAYVFVIEGSIEIQDQELTSRDGFGIWNIDSFEMKAKSGSRVLIMDVPMSL